MTDLTDSERNRAHAIATGSTIIEAVGIAIGRASPTIDKRLAAMAQAAEEAQADGITDPDVIRERVLTARDGVTEG